MSSCSVLIESESNTEPRLNCGKTSPFHEGCFYNTAPTAPTTRPTIAIAGIFCVPAPPVNVAMLAVVVPPRAPAALVAEAERLGPAVTVADGGVTVLTLLAALGAAVAGALDAAELPAAPGGGGGGNSAAASLYFSIVFAGSVSFWLMTMAMPLIQ